MIKVLPEVIANVLLPPFHHKLVEILLWLNTKKYDVTITSGFRNNDPGVHGTMPCRAVDLRTWSYENPLAVEAAINKRWEYDPMREKKQVAIYHDVEGLHLHVQVHDLTRRRKEENWFTEKELEDLRPEEQQNKNSSRRSLKAWSRT